MNKLFNEKRERYYYRQVIRTMGLDNVPVAFGAEKKCHIFNNFVVFKHSVKTFEAGQISDFALNLLTKFQNTQYLANSGIMTPRILDIEFNGDFIYEIQERAPGKVLSYTNESNILNVFGERGKCWNGLNDVSETIRQEVISKVLGHNFDMQKKIKVAPASHFIKFLQGFKDIQEYGLDLDIHGENFLYDTANGFYFIDLPSTQSTAQKKFAPQDLDASDLIFDTKKIKSIERFREMSDFDVARQICCLFGYFLKFSGYSFDLQLVQQMRKNNYTIFKNKLFPAILSAGFVLSDSEWQRLKIYASKFSHKAIEQDPISTHNI